MLDTYTAVGMIEFNSIAAGIEASDQMVKSAQVEPMFFKTICPGKFLAAVYGDVAAVNAAVSSGRATKSETVVDWFVIPNIHHDVIRAMSGGGILSQRQALGVIETFSVASAVLAADAAAKAADVEIIDVRTALGLGGKGYALIGGDVAAVKAAVDAGTVLAAENGMLVSQVVIPRPHASVFDQIL